MITIVYCGLSQQPPRLLKTRQPNTRGISAIMPSLWGRGEGAVEEETDRRGAAYS